MAAGAAAVMAGAAAIIVGADSATQPISVSGGWLIFLTSFPIILFLLVVIATLKKEPKGWWNIDN